MKIALVTLHLRPSAQAVSLAAGCLAAALPAELRKKSRPLDFFLDQNEDDICQALLEESPDLVGFSVYSWNRKRVIALAHRLRQALPELLLVAGGPEATGDPTGFGTTAPWDALILGEGEQAFADLVTDLVAGRTPSSRPGLLWQPAQKLFESPEAIHLADMQPYPSPWLSGLLTPSPEGGVLWEVARGCAFACDYCFEARGPEGVRTIAPERLVAELGLFQELGVSQVWVLDATFNYPPERGVQLLELLIQHAPWFHYHLEAKSDYIDRQIASLLGRLSCSVQLGVQSAQKQVLKTIHRPLDLERLTECVHLLEAEGVTYGFDLICGLPNDDYAGFSQSVDTALSFSPNHVHIFPLAVLPGTRLARQAERYKLSALSEPPYEILSSESWTPDDLRRGKLLAAAVDLFYNTGRAVAFFPTLLRTFETSPAAFFEDFISWALSQPEIDEEVFCDTESWTAKEAYRLQQGYLEQRLRKTGNGYLVSAVLDLLCYHFYYAETLLGEELTPTTEELSNQVDCWDVPWQRSRQVQMVPFAYEVLDLLEMDELELGEFVNLFRPVGSVAMFLRRDNEVICESLGEDFLKLLKSSDGQRSPKEIFAGTVPPETGREMVSFAVAEGLLQAPANRLAT